jgi:hypothetical protein
LGGNLESDVQELAEIPVLAGIALIVAERVGELFAGPAVFLPGGGRHFVTDVDDGGVPGCLEKPGAIPRLGCLVNARGIPVRLV